MEKLKCKCGRTFAWRIDDIIQITCPKCGRQNQIGYVPQSIQFMVKSGQDLTKDNTKNII